MRFFVVTTSAPVIVAIVAGRQAESVDLQPFSFVSSVATSVTPPISVETSVSLKLSVLIITSVSVGESVEGDSVS